MGYYKNLLPKGGGLLETGVWYHRGFTTYLAGFLTKGPPTEVMLV